MPRVTTASPRNMCGNKNILKNILEKSIFKLLCKMAGLLLGFSTFKLLSSVLPK